MNYLEVFIESIKIFLPIGILILFEVFLNHFFEKYRIGIASSVIIVSNLIYLFFTRDTTIVQYISNRSNLWSIVMTFSLGILTSIIASTLFEKISVKIDNIKSYISKWRSLKRKISCIINNIESMYLYEEIRLITIDNILSKIAEVREDLDTLSSYTVETKNIASFLGVNKGYISRLIEYEQEKKKINLVHRLQWIKAEDSIEVVDYIIYEVIEVFIKKLLCDIKAYRYSLQCNNCSKNSSEFCFFTKSSLKSKCNVYENHINHSHFGDKKDIVYKLKYSHIEELKYFEEQLNNVFIDSFNKKLTHNKITINEATRKERIQLVIKKLN